MVLDEEILPELLERDASDDEYNSEEEDEAKDELESMCSTRQISNVSVNPYSSDICNFILAEEEICCRVGSYIRQVQEMRRYAIAAKDLVKQHAMENIDWSELVKTEVADFAQNLGLPHFRSEKPGDIY